MEAIGRRSRDKISPDPPPLPPERHFRQSSAISTSSAEVLQTFGESGTARPNVGGRHFIGCSDSPVSYNHHFRQSSTDTSGTPVPHLLPRRITPLVDDMGYHTLAETGYRATPAPGGRINDIDLSLSGINLQSGEGVCAISDVRGQTMTEVECRPERLDVAYSAGARHHYEQIRPPPPPPTRIRQAPGLNTLSDTLLLKILASIPQRNLISSLCQVSKRFHRLSWHPSLWTTLIFNEADNVGGLGDECLEYLLCRLARRSSAGPLGIQAEFVRNIVVKRPSRATDFTDQSLVLISQKCPNLRRLELRNCPNITDEGLTTLTQACRTSLMAINVSGCRNITATSSVMTRGAAEPSNLSVTYLDLSDCSNVTDKSLEHTAINCSNLSHLYLRRCTKITDIGLKYVSLHCLHLQELSVSDCPQVTDFGLFELAKLGPVLRYMSLAKCSLITDSGLCQLLKMCYKLRYLNIRGCEAISDTSLAVLALSCDRMRSLDIGKCDVTDEGVQSLARSGVRLRKLSLKSCEMVTDAGITAIAAGCPNLVQLNIQDCNQITVDAYVSIKKACKRCIIEHTNPGFG